MVTRSIVLVGVVAVSGCADFYTQLTPSGVPCRDMPVLAFDRATVGKDEINGRRYTRMRPVSSSLSCETEAERVESLRRKSCDLNADAVIEVMQQEIIQPTRKTIRLDGTAVKFYSSKK